MILDSEQINGTYSANIKVSFFKIVFIKIKCQKSDLKIA